jgi:hypothetical protein
VDAADATATTVATLAGSTQGYTDAVGTAAQFNSPWGIVYHKSSGSSGGVLYVADYGNARVRRILVATANVTTVAALPAGSNGICLCITNNGTFLYVTMYYAVVRVNAADGALLTLAGTASNPGFADGVGSSARFNVAQGIALNTDESALVIVDRDNWRIRNFSTHRPPHQFSLDKAYPSTPGVFDTTLDASGSVLYLSQSYHAVFCITNTPASSSPPQLIAGSNSGSAYGATDGPALAATFTNAAGITSDTTNNVAYISDYSGS